MMLRIFLFAGALLAASAALAHGGEDHGAPPPPPSSSDNGVRSVASSTSSLELVARWPATAAGKPFALRVLLSDEETNAPIEGATVTVDLSDPHGASLPSLSLQATSSPGIYEGDVTATVDAVYAAAVTVVAGDLVDVVALSALPFGPPVANETAAHDDAVPASLRWVVAGAVVILIVGILLLLRRRRRGPAAAVVSSVAVLCSMFGAPSVLAHGGEDHGAPATTTAGPASTDTVTLPKESQFLLGIRTARVALAPVSDRLEVPGVVTAPPERHAAIFAPQQGRVLLGGGAGKSLPMLGAPVRKGQVLAVLEAALGVGERASFAVEAAQADTEVAAAQARRAAAEKNLVRLNGLEGVVSQRDRDTAAVDLKEAEAALRAAEAKKSAYGSTEHSTRIVLESPIDGVLADVAVSPGELVEPGRRAFLIVDPAELWVEARVYEADLSRVTKGATANVSVDAWPRQVFHGELLATGEVVDPETRTVKALFRVENASRQLKLGMFAHVQIGAGAASDVLVVAESAVLDVDGRSVVFVHTAPELFQRREVALGRHDGNNVEVRGGVVAGDRVVTTGLLTLKNAAPAPLPAAKKTTPTKTQAQTAVKP